MSVRPSVRHRLFLMATFVSSNLRLSRGQLSGSGCRELSWQWMFSGSGCDDLGRGLGRLGAKGQ